MSYYPPFILANTRLTAFEQPSHVMATLNLYVYSCEDCGCHQQTKQTVKTCFDATHTHIVLEYPLL